MSEGYGREEHELARSKRHSLSLISLEEGRRWGRGITVSLWLLLLTGCAVLSSEGSRSSQGLMRRIRAAATHTDPDREPGAREGSVLLF